MPFPLCLRLWDVFLLEGERLLLAAGYTILKMHRRAIQQLDMDRILDYIQKKSVAWTCPYSLWVAVILWSYVLSVVRATLYIAGSGDSVACTLHGQVTVLPAHCMVR